MQPWLTNDPEVARRLNAADRAYNTARDNAAALPLAAKIEALRAAKTARIAAYRAATREGNEASAASG